MKHFFSSGFTKLSVLLLMLAAVLGLLSAKADYFEMSKNLDIFSSVFKEVNTYYVDDVDPNDMMTKGINAMLASLDPYTNYYPESAIESFRLQTTGKYGGVGSTIIPYQDYTVISEVYKNQPADRAGLQIGDVIIRVAGKDMKGKNTDEVSTALKGQPGTKTELTVLRPQADGSQKEINFSVDRSDIQIENVEFSGYVSEGIGYIYLNQFSDKAAENVKTAFIKLKEEGKMKGLVLDLRGNPGGLLNEAISLVNLFVAKNQKVVETKGRVDEWNKSYYTLEDPIDLEIPIVVLINSGSASASEIVSGSLQDLDRAIVIGERSFGKGLVQTTRKLVYNTQVKITTSKYYIPSGRCIQAIKNYDDVDANGKPKHIPDSLRTAFKTKAGRKVLDGAGIEPDIKIESEELSLISQSLLNKNVIFDFATSYKLNHAQIAALKEFDVSETDWNSFKEFIGDREYEYRTKSEQELEQLEKASREENYFEAAKPELEALRKKLGHDKQQDLEKYKGQIMQLLKEEIALRYYYRSGEVEAALQHDAQLNKAIELLNNAEAYAAILKP